MSYGLYLYKEFPSKSGKIIRLEIFQDSFTGEALEIDELSATPLVLELDNANGELYTPIIKTNLMIGIVNTDQIDYSVFFTPDATKFKVYIKIDGVTEWGGYLTPDSYSEAEMYRSEISLYARDNIGMLATMPFTTSFSIRSIQNLLGDAFNMIEFLNTLEYRVKKLDNEEDSILSGVVTTKSFAGKNWYEVVESLLRGIGCQMRFVGGTKYAIFDIADLAGYGDTLTAQPFLFIGKSGLKEILPAWRTINVSQDFLLQESIYTGSIPASDYVYFATRNAGLLREFSYRPKPPVRTTENYPEDFYLVPFGAYWTSSIPMLNPTTYDKNPNTLLITGGTSSGLLGGTLDYSINLPQTTRGTNIFVRFKLKKTIQGVTRAGRLSSDRILKEIAILPSQKIHFRCNIFFETSTSSQYLSSLGWFDKPTPYNESFDIIPPALDDNENMATAYQDVEFDLGYVDTEGRLSVVIYPYYLENELSLNPENYVLEIKDFDIVLTSNNELISGVTTSTTINEKHNITGNISLNVGQVPFNMGNQLTLGGGIFKNESYYPPMYNFHRPSDDNFRLYELIGREIAHHFKTQKNKLSGTIINSLNFAAMPSFGKVFTDGTLNYLLNYGALDFRNETMQVELIEVEPYIYEDYTFVEAEVSTGSGSLGSGEREFVQWSSAGNAKRIYELDTASEAEQAGAFVFIDKLGLPEAKRVPISSLLVDAYTKSESDSRFASINGDLTQDFSAKKLTTATLLLPQTTPILASGEVAIYSLDSGFSGELPSGAGSVTSISMLVPTGLSVTPTTITESGTFTISYASGYSIPTNIKQSEWDSAYNDKINSATFTASTLTLTQQDGGTIAVSVPTFNQNTTGSAATLTTPRAINVSVSGVSGTAQNFNGSAAITIPVTLTTLTRGDYLTGSNYNGGTATTWAVDATTTATANKVVARDANADIFVRDVNASRKVKGATLILPQSAPILDSGEVGIYSLDSGFSGELPSGSGSVTSIALTMPTGFSVSGSPITESGTFGVTFASGYFLPTTTQFATKADVSLIGAANGIAPLDSGGKVALQHLPNTLLKYMGVWNASTNTPTLLATDVNRKGQVWNVSVAGTQFGIAFKLGDWLIYNDSGVAEKSDNSDDVTSVNGYTGAVTLKTSDIAEQTNLYYTDARVKTYADTLYTPLAHASATNNPHSVTAAQVGALALTGGTMANANLVTNFNAEYLGGLKSAQYLPKTIHAPTSGNGVLVETDLPADSNSMVYATIEGNGYSGGRTMFTTIQFYNRIGDVLASKAINHGDIIPEAKVFSYNSVVYLWIPYQSISRTYYVTVRRYNTSSENRVVSITNAPIPAEGVTKLTTITPENSYTNTSVLSDYMIGSNVAISSSDTIHSAFGKAQGQINERALLAGNIGQPFSASKLTSTTLILPQSAPSLASGEMAIYGLDSGFSGEMPSGAGSVESVALVSNLTGISVTGSPITTSGTFTLNFVSGYSIPTNIKQGEWDNKQAKLVGTGASSLVRVNTLGTITYDDNTYLTAITKAQVEAVLTGTITSHNHNGTYALISGATTQDFQVKALTMNGALSGATDITANGMISGSTLAITSTLGVSHLSFARTSFNYITSAGDFIFITQGKVVSASNPDLYISNGKIGMGTVSPSQKLDVQGNIAIANYVLGGGKDYGNAGNINSATLQLYNNSSGNTILNNGSYGIDFQTGGVSRIFIASGGIVSLTNTTQSTAYNIGALVLSGGLGVAKDLYSNGKAVFASSVQMLENINTNLRIPKVAPTSPTSGQYYFYIVE